MTTKARNTVEERRLSAAIAEWFVSGLGFSRAAKMLQKNRGFSPRALKTDPPNEKNGTTDNTSQSFF
jgi:hypothetical protein